MPPRELKLVAMPAQQPLCPPSLHTAKHALPASFQAQYYIPNLPTPLPVKVLCETRCSGTPSARSVAASLPTASASGWAKKLHISSSWLDTFSPCRQDVGAQKTRKLRELTRRLVRQALPFIEPTAAVPATVPPCSSHAHLPNPETPPPGRIPAAHEIEVEKRNSEILSRHENSHP